MRTHYDHLNIDRDASPEAIRAAYKAMAQQWHPDKNSRNHATRRFKRIRKAYSVLSDPASRALYDTTLAPEPPLMLEHQARESAREGDLSLWKLALSVIFLVTSSTYVVMGAMDGNRLAQVACVVCAGMLPSIPVAMLWSMRRNS